MCSKVMTVALALVMLVTILLPAVTVANDGDIQCIGTVTDHYPEQLVGAKWWNVTVEEVMSGPPPCPEISVVWIASPPFPWGYFDEDITIGDKVEVYGSYNSTDCRVSLNGNENYHITKITVQAPTLTPIGIVALVGLLAILATGTIAMRKRR